MGGRRGRNQAHKPRCLLALPPPTLQLLPSAVRLGSNQAALALDADADCGWLLLHIQPRGYTFISW